MNSIALMDCIEFMRGIASESVGMVLCDPPYNIGYIDAKGDVGNKLWDKPRPIDEYIAWALEWTREAKRILKPNRMLVVWGTLKSEASMRYRLDALPSTGLTPQNEIIWSYNWGGRKKTNFVRKHEVAWCASKGETFLFNGDDPLVRVPRKTKKGYPSVWKDGLPPTTDTIPTCVWEANNHTGSKDHVRWHPSPKNLMVTERMIRAWTEPGEIVIDPFAGSATTGIAALRSGRVFYGCDTEAEYVRRANERVAAELQQLTMPL